MVCRQLVAILMVVVAGSVLPGQDFTVVDFNSDGNVDLSDFHTLAQHFGGEGEFVDGDVNGDGTVGFSDFQVIVNLYGTRTASPAGLPLSNDVSLIRFGDQGRLLLFGDGVNVDSYSLYLESGGLIPDVDGMPKDFEFFLANTTSEITAALLVQKTVNLTGARSLDGQIEPAAGEVVFEFGTSDGVFKGPVIPSLPGDADLDGEVQFSDFVILAENFSSAGIWANGDFDGDGTVDFPDFVALAENFGTSLPVVASAVPEPDSVGFLACIASVLSARCRRRRRN